MWRKLDKVTMYTRGKYSDGIKSFCVETGNKSQEKTAASWAETYDYGFDTFEFENKNGFKAKLVSAAGNSYGNGSSGKLSFWMVEVEKEGKKFSVGVNSECLLECLCNCTMKMGIIQEPVIFAKNGSFLGLIPLKSELYTKLTEDEQTRKSLKVKKTSKPIPGYRHMTLTMNNTYICPIYKYDSDSNKQSEYRLYPDISCLYEYTSLKELIEDEKGLYNLLYCNWSNIVGNIPSRTQGEKVIDININIEEMQEKLKELIKHEEKEIKDSIEKDKFIYYPEMCKYSFIEGETLHNTELLKAYLEYVRKREEESVRNTRWF